MEKLDLNLKDNEDDLLKHKNKNDKRYIKINTNKCRGELKLLKLIIKKREWKEVFDLNTDIYWSGLNLSLEDFIKLGFKTKINRFPGMTDLCHKRETAYILNKFRDFFPDNYEFYPETFILPQDNLKLEFFMKNNNCLLVAKPTAGSQGDGIVILKNIKDLNNLIRTSTFSAYDYIVQRYISDPLIIDEKKFDLRLYVLITSIDPLIIFLNEEGLARFCTQPYKSNDSNNLNNPYVHFSNYSLNKNNKEYKYTEETSEINDASKRTLTSFWKSYESLGHNKKELENKINELINKVIIALYPFLKYHHKLTYGNKYGKCFQILGFDILIDNFLKPWLLEINANPSLSIEHDPEFVTLVEISAVDYFVKEKVVEHAVDLVTMSIEKQTDVTEWKTYKKILNGDLNEMNIFENLLEAFGKLTGYKRKSVLQSNKFYKLANISGFVNDRLHKNDYDIIFKKYCSNKGLDFFGFIEVIEILGKRLFDDYDEKRYEKLNEMINTIIIETN